MGAIVKKERRGGEVEFACLDGLEDKQHCHSPRHHTDNTPFTTPIASLYSWLLCLALLAASKSEKLPQPTIYPPPFFLLHTIHVRHSFTTTYKPKPHTTSFSHTHNHTPTTHTHNSL